jgi:hypothetical protein
MAVDFRTWADDVRQLLHALTVLESRAAALGVPPPDGQEWFELLRHKLLPQLQAEPLLVACIVGGTNIGKSVVFNHLAGEVASASTPLAAGTKHPVCLAPPAAASEQVLAPLFETFLLRPWRSAEDPLDASPENLLFWRPGPRLPPRLLILDAPDVDSDAPVNWERARAIRQAADVLVAVLTQQKYNDAAVKQFFREAARADKPIIVVFNQCDLQADREYWPLWLVTFCEETGAGPELVYVLPYDRRAAHALELPFYEVGPDGRKPLERPVNFRDELAALRFDAIKIRTFRGAMDRVLDAETGAAAYVQTIAAAAAQFAAAAAALSAAEMARVAWPTLPAGALVDEIRAWWDSARSSWSRQIHGFYRVVGRSLTWPLRTAWQRVTVANDPPLLAFHKRERAAVVEAVGNLLHELDRLAQVGNDMLRPRLLKLLRGSARQQLLQRVQEAHAALPAVDDDYRTFLWAELNAWRELNPRAVAFLRSLDHVAAIARPAITVSLAVSGWVLAGDLVGHVAVQAAQQTAGHLATEAVITGGITGGGEVLVNTTGEGIRQAAGRLFGRLQARYAQERVAWLAAWLERELLGELLTDLRQGAEVPGSPAFLGVQAAIQRLRGD